MNDRTSTSVCPIAKTDGILLSEVDDDTLVYNLDDLRAVSLNASAARIRALCDGTRGVSEIAQDSNVSEAATMKTLRDLDRNGLLEPGFDSVACLNRRVFMSKAVKGSLSAGAIPVVLAISLPNAAQAASVLIGNFELCNPGDHCADGPQFGPFGGPNVPYECRGSVFYTGLRCAPAL